MLRPSLIGGARGINKNLQHCYGLQCVSFRKSQCKHILVFCFQLGIKGAIQGSNIEKNSKAVHSYISIIAQHSDSYSASGTQNRSTFISSIEKPYSNTCMHMVESRSCDSVVNSYQGSFFISFRSFAFS